MPKRTAKNCIRINPSQKLGMLAASIASVVALIDERAAPVGGIDTDRQRDDTGDQKRKQRQEKGRLGAVEQR
jgi:hypothetical protein